MPYLLSGRHAAASLRDARTPARSANSARLAGPVTCAAVLLIVASFVWLRPDNSATAIHAGPGTAAAVTRPPSRSIANLRVDIVIARYNESLDWLPVVLSALAAQSVHASVYVYDKGGGPLPAVPKQYTILIQRLVNIGREAQSYLHHMSSPAAAASTSDVTVYLQADPHTEGLCHARFVSTLIQQAATHGLSLNVHRRMTPFYPAWTAAAFGFYFPRGLIDTSYHSAGPRAEMRYTDAPLGPWFDRTLAPALQRPFPRNGVPVPFYVGANFAVRSVLKLPEAAVLRGLAALEHENPEECHFFERSWFFMFASVRDELLGARGGRGAYAWGGDATDLWTLDQKLPDGSFSWEGCRFVGPGFPWAYRAWAARRGHLCGEYVCKR